VFSYWADSYWGGAVAAIAGALVLGALPRIRRHLRARDAILMSIGFALLANSRPYEGLIYTIPFLIVVARFIFAGKAPPFPVTLRRIILPMAAVMIVTFGFMAYYFWRTTGNLFEPPYLVNVSTYMQEPQFIWGKMGLPLHYNHPEMQEFYRGNHVEMYRNAARNLPLTVLVRALEFWSFYVGFALTVPFIILFFVLPYGTSFRDLGHKALFLMCLIATSFAALTLPTPYMSHYAAPLTCAIYALLLQTLRRVRIARRNKKHLGVWMVRSIAVACIVGFVVTVGVMASGVPRERALALLLPKGIVFRSDRSDSNPARQKMIRSFQKQQGKYLIIVRRKPGYEALSWVYNDADIDQSQIVWARDMGANRNSELITYFAGRRAYLLEADEVPPKLSQYADMTKEP
jgi:hypothetical protein